MNQITVKKERTLSVGQAIRKDFADVFAQLGGITGMILWAKKSEANRKVFYSMYAKMVTKEVVTEDKNKTHDQFVKWIQEVEEQEKLLEGTPAKLVS
jgi:hypothetical protein